MSNWKLEELKSGLPGLKPAWLTPKPPCTPLPSMASHQLHIHRAKSSVQEGLTQGVECEGDLAVTLTHHWLPGPIRLVGWPGVFFLPHLCVPQALSCWLRQQEWPWLVKKDPSAVGPRGASSTEWVLKMSPRNASEIIEMNAVGRGSLGSFCRSPSLPPTSLGHILRGVLDAISLFFHCC